MLTIDKIYAVRYVYVQGRFRRCDIHVRKRYTRVLSVSDESCIPKEALHFSGSPELSHEIIGDYVERGVNYHEEIYIRKG